MAFTSPQLRQLLAARVAAVSGLKEATGILGPSREPSTVVDRSFTVVLGQDVAAGERYRQAGEILLTQSFAVRLAHKLHPKDGPAAYDQALADRDAVRARVLQYVNDAARPIQGLIRYRGSIDPVVAGGGGYLLSEVQFTVDVPVSLGA